MDLMHYNKVDNIYEFNLLHDILNPTKHTKNTNSDSPPILHRYMNKCRGRENIKSPKLIGQWMWFQYCNEKSDNKLKTKTYSMMQYHTQLGNLITDMKVKIDFTLP